MKRIDFFCVIIIFSFPLSAGFADPASDHGSTETTKPAAAAVAHTPKAIAKSSNGYYYLAGNSYSREQGAGFWVWKITENGEKVWEERFKSQYQDEVKSIIGTEDGGALLLGQIFVYEPETGHQSWIKQLDKNGAVVFTKDVGGPGWANILLSAADGNYVFAGALRRKENKRKEDYDFRLVKFDAEGDLLWEWFYNKDADESIFSGVNIAQDDFVFAGTSGKFNRFGEGPYLGWVVKIDDAGALLAEAKLPDCKAMQEGSFIAVNDDEFAVVYSTTPLPPVTKAPLVPLPFGARIVGFNYNLKKIWTMNRVGYSSNSAPMIALSRDKHYLVVGAVKEGLKIDKIARGGKLIWEKKIDSGLPDGLRFSVESIITSGNNAYIVGSAEDVVNSSRGSRVFLLKIETGLGEVVLKKIY